jgi:hypothetical protein
MRRTVILVVVALSLLLPQMAQAWNSTGHMLVAAMAYRKLTPACKLQVDNVLQTHPEYAQWSKDLTDVDQDLYVFMQAATWPDAIRTDARYRKYNHPEWHYVDYPLIPPAFMLLPGPQPANDVLYGIDYSRQMIADPNTSAEDRAIYLSWLMHLIGDIHQPLHAVTLFTNAFPAPAGDKGGNYFYVREDNRQPGELHALWDSLLGSTHVPTNLVKMAVELEGDPLLAKEKLDELGADKTPESWSLESRAVAISTAYLNGKLEGAPAVREQDPVTHRTRMVAPPEAPALPDGYRDQATSAARRRVALAGFRLQAELQASFQ